MQVATVRGLVTLKGDKVRLARFQGEGPGLGAARAPFLGGGQHFQSAAIPHVKAGRQFIVAVPHGIPARHLGLEGQESGATRCLVLHGVVGGGGGRQVCIRREQRQRLVRVGCEDGVARAFAWYSSIRSANNLTGLLKRIVSKPLSFPSAAHMCESDGCRFHRDLPFQVI